MKTKTVIILAGIAVTWLGVMAIGMGDNSDPTAVNKRYLLLASGILTLGYGITRKR